MRKKRYPRRLREAHILNRILIHDELITSTPEERRVAEKYIRRWLGVSKRSVTGRLNRLSVLDPNLVKRMRIPNQRMDASLVSMAADYSKIEARVVAHWMDKAPKFIGTFDFNPERYKKD